MELELSGIIVIISFIVAFLLLIRFIKNDNPTQKIIYPRTDKTEPRAKNFYSIKNRLFWIIFGVIMMIIISLFYFMLYTGNEVTF